MNNSALRTADILLLLSQGSMTVSQVSAALSIPKTSAYDILSALVEKGFAQVDEFKRYSLGLATYRVGMCYIGSTDLFTVGHHRLQKLSATLGQTVYLAVEDKGSVTYIDKAEQDSPIRFSRNPGDRNELYRTGLGKAILAARPELVDALPFPLQRRTQTTLCTKQALLADLSDTVRRGYALDLGEDNELLRCVAVPVRDREGVAIGALSCSMLAPEFEKADIPAMVHALFQTALEISHSLGFSGLKLYE